MTPKKLSKKIIQSSVSYKGALVLDLKQQQSIAKQYNESLFDVRAVARRLGIGV